MRTDRARLFRETARKRANRYRSCAKPSVGPRCWRPAARHTQDAGLGAHLVAPTRTALRRRRGGMEQKGAAAVAERLLALAWPQPSFQRLVGRACPTAPPVR